MPRALKILLFAMSVVGLGASLASCGNGHAQYRIVNGIAGSAYNTGVDIQMNGATAFTSVAFRSTEPGSSGTYTKIAAGSETLEVFPAGEAGDANAQIITSTLNLQDTTQLPQYTVVLTGSTSSNLAATVYSDDNYTIPTSGNAAFRVINESPSTTATNGVDVYIVPPGVELSGLTPTISSLQFGSATGKNLSSPYTDVGVPTGSTLYVYVTAPGGKGEFGYPFPQTVGGLTGGQSIRTIVLTDYPGATLPPDLLVLTDVN
jgi:hypothetical protein